MKNAECVDFLQWCLPRLRLRWAGFRKPRAQVCKRLARRLTELGLADLAAYRAYLEEHAEEWREVDAFCRITISRFFRDRAVFEALDEDVLPALVRAAIERGDRRVRAWSCGCASGEEPATLALLWGARLARAAPDVELEIVATDIDPALLERARRGIYETSSLRELPAGLLASGFDEIDGRVRLRPALARTISYVCQDVRRESPPGPFDLVLCRNLVLTYFDESLLREVMERVVAILHPGGALVVGAHEVLPQLSIACEPWGSRALPVYRRIG